jgi:hypothetical protein
MRGVCFIVLICAGNLAAQAEIAGDQCLGGSLTAIQAESISLKFNDNVTTIRVAPDAEIWRRGTDLGSIHQLVIGDQIYLKCSKAGATVVAAVEQDDAVQLVPHHITEISACIGRLIAITNDTLSVKNNQGGCVIHTTAQTTFWRGETSHDASAFKLGDEVGARVTVSYPGRILTAEHVEANVTKVEGTVISAQSDRIVVRDDRSRERVTVLRDSEMQIVQGAAWPGKGAEVMVTGLDLVTIPCGPSESGWRNSDSVLRQRERHDATTRRGVVLSAAAYDHHIFPAIHFVNRGRRIARGR